MPEEEIKEVIETANATEFINALPQKLDTSIGPKGAQLSGGQKQRLSIARALIRKPKIILMDEATSSLDTISENRVQKAIEGLFSRQTTFIVANRLSTIKKADRVVVMKHGQAVEIGTHKELNNKKGEYYRLRKFQEI